VDGPWPVGPTGFFVVVPPLPGGLRTDSHGEHRPVKCNGSTDSLGAHVRLAGDALDNCRRRVQQDFMATGAAPPIRFYTARRMLHTGVGLH
jgi:hypothetical protein